MRIRALIGFVATHEGRKYRVQAGDELDMPDGADWVTAGLAELIEEQPTVKTKRSSKTSK